MDSIQKEKKVLIITYYWPPSGGSGVQRWLKMVKYLPQFGWTPYVFTPENPTFDIKDITLMKDVPIQAKIIHYPIWEPYHLFFKLSGLLGRKKSAKPLDFVNTNKTSLFERMSTWLRGNLIVPDPRVFWVRPSVKFLTEFLEASKIETVITTGPPHSMHLIGYQLKKKFPNLKWIADFRDPWSEWGFLDSLGISKQVRKIHKRLEYQVLSTADLVTTITPFYVRHFERLGNTKAELIPNGYDGDDFKDLKITRGLKFVLRHVGIVNEKCNPRPFMLAVKKAMELNQSFAEDVQVEFIGDVNAGFRQFASSTDLIKDITVFTQRIPHKELISVYGSSSILLLVLTGYKDAEGYMPGKMFEYLATGLPVLGVGPVDGDASFVLNESGAGKMFDGDDQDGIADFILDKYSGWKNNLSSISHSDNSKFSRKRITEKLVQLLES